MDVSKGGAGWSGDREWSGVELGWSRVERGWGGMSGVVPLYLLDPPFNVGTLNKSLFSAFHI